MKYAWIQEQQAGFSVSRVCRGLEVSRRGYYEWRGRLPRAKTAAAQQVAAKVQQYFAQGRGTYGPRRIKHLLAQEGLQVSRRRIGRIRAPADIQSTDGRRPGPDSRPESAQPGV